jgi:ABC-2 type transport system ATP-binding protein
MSLNVEHVNKFFGDFQAIKDLSMEVKEGGLFGFLGPNGAGKTTTMRMILDIFRPDSGRITWNGTPVSEVSRRKWGYLPEERGLYPKMEVGEQLIFLARLYGFSQEAAEKELDDWLERFQITANRNRTVEELSKGNQQKIQFLAAVLHNPDILIMDEPFSGLDPINANILKDAILEMHERGKTIIFSTHQMEQVEELCEDIVLINKGEAILQGNVHEIKHQYGRNVVRIKLENDEQAPWLDHLPGIQVMERRQDYIELRIQSNLDPSMILNEALQRNDRIDLFQLGEASLNEIFIQRVGSTGLPDASNNSPGGLEAKRNGK